MKKNDQRRFLRGVCRFVVEFRLSDEDADWIPADVLDFTVAGIRVCFEQERNGIVLSEEDVEWKEARFRFRTPPDELLVKGHFLKVYAKRDGRFTAGVEFMDVTPELQFDLMRFYAGHRREMADEPR